MRRTGEGNLTAVIDEIIVKKYKCDEVETVKTTLGKARAALKTARKAFKFEKELRNLLEDLWDRTLGTK